MHKVRRRLPLPLASLIMLLLAVLALFWLFGTRTAALQAEAKQPAGKCSKAEEFQEVPGLGPSCRKHDGSWKVKLRDGTTVETHGPDSAALAEDRSTVVAAALSSQTCVTDLVNGYYGMLVYVYASDQADNSATANSTILSYFQSAQDKLYAEFQEFGQTGSYKMACNSDGSLRIVKLRLSTTLANTNFSTVQSDLRAAGYNNTHAKYWIYTDKKPPTANYCGVAGLYSDDRLVVDNASNKGPGYAFNPACNAFMHENGHNLGAVQNSAPNSSGAGHCNDDRDVMCYNDGGSKSGGFRTDVCTDREHYDCNHNDYFHPNPPAGNYLATHWNIGNCMNRFIERSGCGTPPPTATRTATSGTNPTATRTRTPTVGGPSATATRTATTGTGGACSPATAITAPFTKDGSGSFCWQISTIPSYINSWNVNSLTVNGVSFTNLYATPSQLPAKINGFWYIAYNSSVAWGHFELR